MHGLFLDVDPSHRLVLEFDERPTAGDMTTATVTMTATDGEAMLHIRQIGFRDGPEWDAFHDGTCTGWPDTTADLPFLLGTGSARPGGSRTG